MLHRNPAKQWGAAYNGSSHSAAGHAAEGRAQHLLLAQLREAVRREDPVQTALLLSALFREFKSFPVAVFEGTLQLLGYSRAEKSRDDGSGKTGQSLWGKLEAKALGMLHLLLKASPTPALQEFLAEKLIVFLFSANLPEAAFHFSTACLETVDGAHPSGMEHYAGLTGIPLHTLSQNGMLHGYAGAAALAMYQVHAAAAEGHWLSAGSGGGAVRVGGAAAGSGDGGAGMSRVAFPSLSSAASPGSSLPSWLKLPLHYVCSAAAAHSSSSSLLSAGPLSQQHLHLHQSEQGAGGWVSPVASTLFRGTLHFCRALEQGCQAAWTLQGLLTSLLAAGRASAAAQLCRDWLLLAAQESGCLGGGTEVASPPFLSPSPSPSPSTVSMPLEGHIELVEGALGGAQLHRRRRRTKEQIAADLARAAAVAAGGGADGSGSGAGSAEEAAPTVELTLWQAAMQRLYRLLALGDLPLTSSSSTPTPTARADAAVMAATSPLFHQALQKLQGTGTAAAGRGGGLRGRSDSEQQDAAITFPLFSRYYKQQQGGKESGKKRGRGKQSGHGLLPGSRGRKGGKQRALSVDSVGSAAAALQEETLQQDLQALLMGQLKGPSLSASASTVAAAGAGALGGLLALPAFLQGGRDRASSEASIASSVGRGESTSTLSSSLPSDVWMQLPQTLVHPAVSQFRVGAASSAKESSALAAADPAAGQVPTAAGEESEEEEEQWSDSSSSSISSSSSSSSEEEEAESSDDDEGLLLEPLNASSSSRRRGLPVTRHTQPPPSHSSSRAPMAASSPPSHAAPAVLLRAAQRAWMEQAELKLEKQKAAAAAEIKSRAAAEAAAVASKSKGKGGRGGRKKKRRDFSSEEESAVSSEEEREGTEAQAGAKLQHQWLPEHLRELLSSHLSSASMWRRMGLQLQGGRGPHYPWALAASLLSCLRGNPCSWRSSLEAETDAPEASAVDTAAASKGLYPGLPAVFLQSSSSVTTRGTASGASAAAPTFLTPSHLPKLRAALTAALQVQQARQEGLHALQHSSSPAGAALECQGCRRVGGSSSSREPCVCALLLEERAKAWKEKMASLKSVLTAPAPSAPPVPLALSLPSSAPPVSATLLAHGPPADTVLELLLLQLLDLLLARAEDAAAAGRPLPLPSASSPSQLPLSCGSVGIGWSQRSARALQQLSSQQDSLLDRLADAYALPPLVLLRAVTSKAMACLPAHGGKGSPAVDLAAAAGADVSIQGLELSSAAAERLTQAEGMDPTLDAMATVLAFTAAACSVA